MKVEILVTTTYKYQRLFYAALRQQAAPIIDIARNQGPDEALMQIPLFVSDEPLLAVFRRLIFDVGMKSSARSRTELLRRTRKADEADGWVSYFNEFIGPQMLGRKLDRIKNMTTTTQKLLNDYLSDAMGKGLSVPNIAKELQSAFSVASKSRAIMIAQTEIISASNEAAYLGAESAGIAYKKFWSTSGLTGVRESHMHAEEWSYNQDGIDPHEAFDMGDGTHMMYPGDEAGGAANIINCRCSLITLPV